MKNIEWKKSSIDYDKLNELTHKQITSRENGLLVATKINKNQGKKNSENGHMKSIQKLGASIGGKTIALINEQTGELKKRAINGSKVTKEKYGVHIISTNLITGESITHLSIRDAERYTKIQTPIIRKILKGEQPKTRNGWVFKKI